MLTMRKLIESITLNEYFLIPGREEQTFTWKQLIDVMETQEDLEGNFEDYSSSQSVSSPPESLRKIFYKQRFAYYEIDKVRNNIINRIKKMNLLFIVSLSFVKIMNSQDTALFSFLLFHKQHFIYNKSISDIYTVKIYS